ncbi:MAG: FkbM family methyltransferase [Caulobacterales bacterium]
MSNAMISYAQNFEDVLLNRCFDGQQQGYYIDIGAGHPIQDSVTYWFYRRGWTGINVDASELMFNALSRYRRRDINERAVVLSQSSAVTFYDSGLSGLSSISSKLSEISRARGFGVSSTVMRSRTLTSICEQHKVDSIDFLKIDVEGAELEVINGMNFDRWRPRVVVIEAVDPVSAVYCNADVAAAMSQLSFKRVYFDGLNDYFVRLESIELERHFGTPVNIFDGFIRWRDLSPSVAASLPDASAFRDGFSLRMRRAWASISIEDEVRMELEQWGITSAGDVLTAEDVIRTYREVLCRIPSDAEVESWLSFPTAAEGPKALLQALLSSHEYCQKVLEFGGV